MACRSKRWQTKTATVTNKFGLSSCTTRCFCTPPSRTGSTNSNGASLNYRKATDDDDYGFDGMTRTRVPGPSIHHQESLRDMHMSDLQKHQLSYYKDPKKYGTSRMPVDYKLLGEKYWKNSNFPAFGHKMPSGFKENKDISEFLSQASNAFKQEHPEIEITDEDIKQTFEEWYLRKLEENKWTHFTNQMISSRFTRPWEWDRSDPLPDWTEQHGYPTESSSVHLRPKQSRGNQLPSKVPIPQLTGDGSSALGDFGSEYGKYLTDEFSKDIRPPYLESMMKGFNLKIPENSENYHGKSRDSGVGGQTGWEDKGGQLREFFETFHDNAEYQLDNTRLPHIPDNYYDPHIPLPAYRNHESLLTIDPRNPYYIERGNGTVEDDRALMLKNGLKLHKKQQDSTGVAYTPDFDFDLWSEDVNRPLSPTNTYNFLNIQSGKDISIQRKQLSQRMKQIRQEFAPIHEQTKLVEFRWRSRMTRNQYQPSRPPVFTVMKIKGNGRGCAGLAFGRASTYDTAARKADLIATYNMIYLPRYRNHSISSTLHGKFNNIECFIEPKPLGYGERGPPIIKAVCHAFGIRDYAARFGGNMHTRFSKITQMKCIWSAFLRATNPEMDCEDRGQRMVEAYPEVHGVSYQLPRGWSHDNVQFARAILAKHEKDYEKEEGFSQYEINEFDRKKLPQWIVEEAKDFWEGGMPDISDYEWRADLIDILNQKGPAGIPQHKEKQIQRLLAEKVDPCDHQFRWLNGMIQVGPAQAMGM